MKSNRTKFAEAVLQALDLRRCEELPRSLKNLHCEGALLAEQGLEEWSRTLPNEDVESLLDNRAGKAVRWVPGQGWQENRA